MNKVMLIGRLARDPEIRRTQEGMAIARTALAVDMRNGEANFFPVTAFGKVAEHMEKFWSKGMKAAIVGRLENNTFTGRDGQKRTETRIIIEEIDFCEPKGESKSEKKEAPKTWADVPDEGEDLPFNFS